MRATGTINEDQVPKTDGRWANRMRRRPAGSTCTAVVEHRTAIVVVDGEVRVVSEGTLTQLRTLSSVPNEA